MEGHEIHSLLRLAFDDIEKILCPHPGKSAPLSGRFNGRLIDRNRSYRDGRMTNDLLSDGINVSACAQIHHGVGPCLNGYLQFFQFFFKVDMVGGGPEIGIDFDPEPFANPHGLDSLMIPIGRYDDATRGDLISDPLRRNSFLSGNSLHLFCDIALLGLDPLCHQTTFLLMIMESSATCLRRSPYQPPSTRCFVLILQGHGVNAFKIFSTTSIGLLPRTRIMGSLPTSPSS